jgi:hypothetical protein
MSHSETPSLVPEAVWRRWTMSRAMPEGMLDREEDDDDDDRARAI